MYILYTYTYIDKEILQTVTKLEVFHFIFDSYKEFVPNVL